METIELKSIATIRTLSIDAIEKANSGHPGMPMGAAPMAYALWTNHLNVSPQNPNWFNRDRFVLSAGHGSMLLYSMLHLSGYNLSIEDLKQFRQWGSKTPGHPEFGHTEGVDATTGPLGQGIAMAVGMALAERHLAETYNKDNFNVVDHYTYSICGDGDLMEGISSEAASLAGHLGLGRLIVLYDSNDISLDGDLDRSFSENVKNRFEAMNWEVLYVKDGNNIEEVTAAIEKAKQSTDKPTLIEVKTTIGFGSPNRAGTSGVHGAPLGSEEAKLTKEAYSWTFEEDFHVPSEVYDHFKTAVKDAGQKKESAWNELFEQYEKEYPELAAQLKLAIEGKLPENWDQEVPVYEAGSSLASRASSGEVLNGIAKQVPFFIGGSADLAGSNKTTIKDTTDFGRENYAGRNIWFGVREFAMGAALNGMALHGGLRVFGGTFFVFSDYLRPAIRLAALMGLPVTYVFTHDSIAVGEDGPTHEPVEQLASLRAMPNLSVIRPADGNETAAAWKIAVSSTNKPTALVLTRQNLPTIDQAPEKAYEGVEKGGYVVVEAADAQPEALLLASGSEVGLAIEAQKALEKEGIRVSVVSLPAWDRFDEQSDEYKESVLPKAVRARVAIEMGASLGWERYTGLDGDVIAIDKFGASAPGETIIEKYGFTVSNVVSRVKAKLNK
ncbi:transketolase [Bacillus altitudinis]|uniref:transketolase n=1 Tax=Bacillus altitudinis TaxID=293387 RepID=UPI0002BD998A|nr:transketolase [Bacillus altitudinis]EMI13258.1 transketolase [Bacillus stratosphericus LAMA 585]MCA0924184.1 transketolase [Bacillus stratosphericus]UJM29367.1 transketolase [Bacillus aerophilus]MDI6647345.1 transketolase [Bacillus altitudinis]MDI6661968.1 transketolase [Bacillus altitudinis]